MESKYNELCRSYKMFHDYIHGFISLSVFATRIIDNPFFQRLRKLKQLGVCEYVYQNGVHTRFEHSIGTYHIADEQLKTIVSTTDPKSIEKYMSNIPELQSYYNNIYNSIKYPLDAFICELIKISALCHDIGHGPFSHVFDDMFLHKLNKQNDYCATHEGRSCVILEKIIKEDEMLSFIGQGEINFMKNIINPQCNNIGYIYQIVSNSVTGLDVDKFDYLARDIYALKFQASVDTNRLVKHIRIIDNNIVYPEQSIDDIYNLFQTRFRLHKQVYCHKVVISIQFIIVEIMELLDDILHISSSITDMNKFKLLTDEYIFESIKVLEKLKFTMPEQQIQTIDTAINLVKKIESRNIYVPVYHNISKKKINYNDLLDNVNCKDDIIIFQTKIGFVSGNKSNPFDHIYVYKTKDSAKISHKLEAYKKDKYQFTILMPEDYQEYITIIYCKNKNNRQRISELTEMFRNIT